MPPPQQQPERQQENHPQPASSPIPLPPPFHHTSPPPTLHAQGAESLLYRTTYLSSSCAAFLKYRPRKSYRHPTLDARLTRHRILAEARVLTRLRREGVRVPGVYALDWEAGWMVGEWVEGRTVREALDVDGTELAEREGLMRKIGVEVGRMHAAGVVHGDLTTSNIMVRAQGEAEVVLIDFGLAAQTCQDEDRAVDLYVLERAFGSTHPRAEGLFREVLRAYGESYKGAKVVLKKLEEVRMRGRKRSMVG